MTDWFRSWHGAPTDPKWRTVARRAGVRPGDVAAVVWVLLDRASQATPRGSIAGYDAEVIADALGFEPAEVEAVIAGLRGKDVLDGDVFVSWEKHQPSREDNSAERAKAWRERNRTQANAPERTQPQTSAREEESREDTEEREEEERVAPAEADAAQPIEIPSPKARPLEREWMPSPETLARGKALGLSEDDLDRSLGRFKNHHCDMGNRSGSHRTDWNPAFVNWIEADASRRKPAGRPTTATPAPAVWVPEGSPEWGLVAKARGRPPIVSHFRGQPGTYAQPHELQEAAA